MLFSPPSPSESFLIIQCHSLEAVVFSQEVTAALREYS